MIPQITSIETVSNKRFPKALWVILHSSDGAKGLGETSFGPAVVETFIHSEAAPLVLGQDPRNMDKLWTSISRIGVTGRVQGAEMRGLSALDMALWDMRARVLGVPVSQLLGGMSRDKVRVYNTCAGYSYGVNQKGAMPAGVPDYRPEMPYEDYYAFMNDAGTLAASLLSEGFTAMKIWPFDKFAPASGGQYISKKELSEGAEPFRLIREKVGDKIDVMLELHSMWNLQSAEKIAKAVEPYGPFWIEDPVVMDDPGALAEFRRSTSIAVTASETVASRWRFRELLEKRAMNICMLDVCWTGGISEARRIAAMAEAFQIPVAPHDCVGPVSFLFSLQLSLSAPNGLIQEVVRAHMSSWYKEIVDTLPKVEGGYAYPIEATGCGAWLKDSLFEDPDTSIRTTTL